MRTIFVCEGCGRSFYGVYHSGCSCGSHNWQVCYVKGVVC